MFLKPERLARAAARGARRVQCLLAAACLLGAAVPAGANNLRVSNVGLALEDIAGRTATIVFDLAWDHSWRDGDHRDAAWVFVKFKAPGSNNWEHALLSTNSGDHAAGTNGAVAAVPDGVGVFVHAATNHAGSAVYPRTRLRWNYGSNGYDFATGEVVELAVLAVETVYIPECAFYLGSGGSESGHFYKYSDGSQSTNIYLVDSENAITVGTDSSNLYYTGVPTYGDGAGPISNDFPKGFAAFYCMKYELTQGQYTDFLNTLTSVQAGARYGFVSTDRYTISGVYPGFVAGAPDRACNWLKWSDLAAYADWAGLRPMTELEYEKACRGPADPTPNEYAWGNTSVVSMTNEDGLAGSGVETPLPANANCNMHFNFSGPARAGIFAASGTTRQGSGAGYYGVLELCGNIVEWTITVGTNAGRAFTGLHGDGVLAANGNADVAGWPGTSAVGSGIRDSYNAHRGGLWWQNAGAGGAVSDRRYVNVPRPDPDRGWVSGGRAVRTAP